MKAVRLIAWFIGAGVVALPLILALSLYCRPVNPKVVSGAVRVQATKVAEDGDTVHWRWTITGDRKWTSFQSASTKQGYPLVMNTEGNPLGGFLSSSRSSVLRCELTVSRGNVTAQGETSYTESVEIQDEKGEGPAAISGTTFAAATVPAKNLVNILISKETILNLPALVNLATVDGEPVSVQLNP